MGIEALGIIGSLLFIASSAAQAVLSMKQGHSRGVSHIMLWAVMIGMTCWLIYAIAQVRDYILISCLLGQGLCWGIVLKYKYFERRRGNGEEESN